jgi:hypothetical protein
MSKSPVWRAHCRPPGLCVREGPGGEDIYTYRPHPEFGGVGGRRSKFRKAADFLRFRPIVRRDRRHESMASARLAGDEQKEKQTRPVT